MNLLFVWLREGLLLGTATRLTYMYSFKMVTGRNIIWHCNAPEPLMPTACTAAAQLMLHSHAQGELGNLEHHHLQNIRTTGFAKSWAT